jgi:hypothetical protein
MAEFVPCDIGSPITSDLTLSALIACCSAWEPQVRILGNVRAGDAVAVLTAMRSEIELLQSKLKEIGDYAHDNSAGPAVQDALWEVRSMAYDAI